MKKLFVSALVFGLFIFSGPASAATLKALIVDGQNNHAWRETTPVLQKILEQAGFSVEVATSPPARSDLSGFKPAFAKFNVVVSNYNGEPWPKETQAAFVEYIRNGGGFVSFHAANNSFPDWPEYNAIIGLGGWGGRNEKSGPYLYWQEKAAKVVRDGEPGRGGSHGQQHEFVVEIRDAKHPITAGLPTRWMHAKDELYDRLRGPAENLTVLATAFADPATKGSGRHEPMLMTLSFGKGRVFHTTLGHSVGAMQCVGFIVTTQRGVEWAATGKVTQRVPADFPSPDKVTLRNF